jgi:hypothetical protein
MHIVHLQINKKDNTMINMVQNKINPRVKDNIIQMEDKILMNKTLFLDNFLEEALIKRI